MEWKTPARSVLIPWVLLVLVTIALIAWLRFAPPGASWSPQRLIGMQMPEAEKIKEIVKIEVPGPETIKIVPKGKVKDLYDDLPTPQTMADNSACVLAVTEIPPSPGGGTAISVLTTGKDNVAVGTIEFQPKKTPFFALVRDLGVRGGVGTGGMVLGELYARPVRVGPAFLEVRAFAQRTDRNGADFGGIVLFDVKF